MDEKGDREKELTETLRGIRRYVENQLKTAISKIYLDWAVGVLLACITQRLLLSNLPEGYSGLLSSLLWLTVIAIILLDTARGFSRIKVLFKLTGRKEELRQFERGYRRSFIVWLVAGIISFFPLYYAFELLAPARAPILSVLTFVGLGNLLMWIFLTSRRSIEILFVGISLLASVPLLALFPSDISSIIGCLLISLVYALAGISIHFRWK